MAMPARNGPFSSKSSNHEQADAFWDQGTDTHPWETARTSGNMRKFLGFSFFLPLNHCSRLKQIFHTAHHCLLRPRNLQAKSH